MNEALHRAGGIVEDVDLLPVLLAEEGRRGLQAFQRALPDGVRGHQHNELGQFFVLVQPVNRLDKGEGLAGASLHQHIQRQRGRGRDRHLHLARVDVVARPNRGEVGAQGGRGLGRHQGRVAVHVDGCHKTHVVEHLRKGLHRRGLVGERGVLKLGRHVSWRAGRGPRKW